MEQKKYPTNSVTITTEEYKDLVAEAAEFRKDAEMYARRYYDVNSENKELKQEIERMRNRIAELECKCIYEEVEK